MTISKLLFAAGTLTASLLLPYSAVAMQTGTAPAPAKDMTKTDKARKGSMKAAPTPAPTAAEISDAQAKGMVWVNKNTKVYHKSGDFYGKTKSGEFLSEADAQKAGYKAAQEPVAKKKRAPKASAATPNK